MSEARQTRLKRLKMRSMRRGIKEMDIILSRFADDCLPTMSPEELDIYEDFKGRVDEARTSLINFLNEHISMSRLFANILSKVRICS